MLKVGSFVVRKSYKKDIVFMISELNKHNAILVGYSTRLIADAPTSDLELVGDKEINSEKQKMKKIVENVRKSNRKRKAQFSKYLPGRVLHLDGDAGYLKTCQNVYNQMKIPAQCFFVNEEDLPYEITRFVKKLRPNIIVITGHDSFNKGDKRDLKNYKNSKYFVETVKKIREMHPSYEYPIIIAGACQSHFEALIGAGANFASSPKRVNVNSLDPTIIAIKCSITRYREKVDLVDAISETDKKADGYGAVETNGCLRLIYS